MSREGLRVVNARIELWQRAQMHVLRFEANAGIVGVHVLGHGIKEITTAAQPAHVLRVELYGVEVTTLR